MSSEEKLKLYCDAIISLFCKVLDFAAVNYATGESYAYYRNLIKTTYFEETPLGPDVQVLAANGVDVDEICRLIERDYKIICSEYKGWYLDIVRKSYENELNAEGFLYNKLPDPGDMEAFRALMNEYSENVFQNVVKQATDGDVSAQVFLGKLYFLGWGTAVNPHEGLFWFIKAADKGDADALLYAGMAYECVTEAETGIRLNEWSCQYYYAAYNAGKVEAAYALYRYFNRFVCGKKGQFRAKRWLKIGIEKGCPYCKYEIYEAPQKPWTLSNTNNAVRWIQEAAQINIPKALELLGDLYFQGHAGLSMDLDMAERLFEQSNKE